MKNNKRPSIRMRLLAWMMAAIMMCTGLNVTAYAQEISFDEGYALEQQEEQVTDEENAEEIQQDEADTENSFEGPWDTEDTDEDDITIEDAQVQDDTDTEKTDVDEAEVFSDADDQNAVEAFSDGGSESDGETATVKVNFSFSQDDRFADSEFENGVISEPVALKQLTVPYFDLANYGLEEFYFKSETYSPSDKGTTGMEGTAETARNHVTLLHLIIYATEVLYFGLGDDEAGQGYLKNEGYLDDGETLNITGSPGSLYMEHLWGLDQNLIYYLNYEYPIASPGWGSTADQILLHDGDVVTLSHYSDWSFYSDSGAGFNYLTDENGSRTSVVADRGEKDSITFQTWRAQADMNGGETVQSKMTGKYQLYYISVDDMWDGDVASWTPLGETENGELKVDLNNIPNGEYFVGIPGQPGAEYTDVICSSPGGIYLEVTGSDHVQHMWDEGVVTKKATCKNTGEKTYTCTVCGETKTETIAKTNDHKYTWKTVSKATVFQPEKQEGICDACGDTITRDNGTKLAATIKLNAKSIKLQKKQTTKKIKVTMANGDSIKSWKSSNKKIVTVNKKGVIKAGKKNGTAKITVTLASGKKATLKVKVQSPRVNTTKIKGLKSKVSLKKGEKLTLKPAISPLTAQDKVTYTSSNKKVATVSKKGVITAKKKGTVKITVKSGKKSYTVKVKVK